MMDLEEHEVQYDQGKKIFYYAAGPNDGPLIIFIHGWPAYGKFWRPQLEAFSSLGFRAVAPDMPGYGRSTARKVAEDYSQENINIGMAAVLEDVGREAAVWIGHDWGAPAVWTFAAHYPEKCIAVAGLTVPYHTLELGLEEVLKYVNRDIYPEKEYPFGQWSYQNFYETDFEKATAWFDSDIESFLRAIFTKQSKPGEGYGLPAITSNVSKDGGWFGGIPKPGENWKHAPEIFIDEDIFREHVAGMEKNTFWPADAWYSNHARNRKYSLEKWKNDGYLHMPVLFIEAQFDAICATALSNLSEPMRKYCPKLTEVSIDSGHWVAEEKPQEVSAAIARWIVESFPQYWPGYWKHAHVKNH